MDSNKSKIANGISILGNPLITLPVISGLVFIEIGGIEFGFSAMGLIFIMMVLPVISWIVVMQRSGRYSNFDVSDKGQRVSFYYVLIPILLLSSLILYLYNQPDYFYRGVLIASFLMAVCYLINFISKISLHVSLNAYLAISIILFNAFLSFFVLTLTLLVGWSRVYLKRHSKSEVILGLMAGIMAGATFLYIQNQPIGSNISQLDNQNDLFTTCENSNIHPTSNGSLEVFPMVSFIDEPIKIKVTQLEPFQKAGLRVMVTDTNGYKWESFACYQANELGEIDPSLQEPLNHSSFVVFPWIPHAHIEG